MKSPAAHKAEYIQKRSWGSHRLWKAKPPLLTHIDIELTERCDNDCVHCCINLPDNDIRAKEREVDTDRWKDVLTQVADLGALSVRFTGGEPLLREDFKELYLYARRLGLKVLLFTNARNITPELAALFVRIPPLEKIEVTVYGMCRSSYEAVSRKPGSYKEFRNGVDLLLQSRIPFVVKGALLPANKKEIAAFESWAATIPWMDTPPSYAMTFELRGRRDSPKKNKLIKSLRVSPKDVVHILNRYPEPYRKEMSQFCRKFIGPPGDELFACGAGYGACVDAYGFVQPCLSLRDPNLSVSLEKVSLRHALTKVFPNLRNMSAADQNYLQRCARCFLKGLCEQCPAKSWSEHGNLDTPVEYLCAVAHEQAKALGLLHPGERAWAVSDWKRRINDMEDYNEKD